MKRRKTERIRVLPWFRALARKRAAQLGLSISEYLTAVVREDLERPPGASVARR
jgi:hypothetical protein